MQQEGASEEDDVGSDEPVSEDFADEPEASISEEESLSEDEDGNVVSKLPVAKRAGTATRAKAKATAAAAALARKEEAGAAVPSKRRARKSAVAAARPTTRKAKPRVLPNLIRKHDVGVFEDSEEDDEDDSGTQARAVDFRHLNLKEDHSHRCRLLLLC
jgi:hypothetical protein